MSDNPDWPELPFARWQTTCATLHMWTQIVGKIRRVSTPWLNHSWGVALYVTARGLTTSPMFHRRRSFQIDFDFVAHVLVIRTAEDVQTMPLTARSVADFYRELFGRLSGLGLDIAIDVHPNEVLEPIPFDQDEVHASYDADAVQRFWRALVQADRVFKRFRAGYIGKASPVHFFWGSFDLAVTRFSGRRAPPHPGGVPNCPDWITREAYSHELSSCGFWPGGEALPTPVFYAYAYPEPAGFATSAIRPPQAVYNSSFREFVLPYDEVRHAESPDGMLLAFLQDSYERAADLGHWDRPALEADASDLAHASERVC
jgi:hypothetical protein